MSEAEHLARARALVAEGDGERAEQAIMAAWPKPEAAPAEARFLMGLIRRGQNRIGDARRFLAAAIVADPSNALYHFTLGDLLARFGELASAAEFFAETLALDPNFPNARRAFARAALHAGRHEEAEQAARALIDTTPDADAWDILSCALRLQDRDEEAFAAAERALAFDRASIPVRHDWAVAAGKLGRAEEAVALFRQLQAEGVAAPGLTLNLGGALLELGRLDEAERALGDGVGRWPTDVALHTALAKTRWLAGAGDAFASSFEEAVARQPHDSALRASCAEILRVAGFEVRARVLIDKGLALRASDPLLSEALGALHEASDELEAAEPLLRRAVHHQPGNDATRVQWLRLLLRMGRADEVLAELAPLRDRAPLNQIWIALQSLALRQKGDPAYARLCDYDLMVQVYDLPPPRGHSSIAAFNAALAEALARREVGRAHPLDQTLRNGAQSGPNLTRVNDPIIAQYLSALEEPIRAYCSVMRDPAHPWSGRNTGAFKLSGAWSVRLFAGGHHVNHVHPKGWISSSYYVALPDAMDEGVQYAGWLKFGEPPRPTPGCGVEGYVRPEAGKLVLFPSYFWHGTVAFPRGERLTAPFDVVPV